MKQIIIISSFLFFNNLFSQILNDSLSLEIIAKEQSFQIQPIIGKDPNFSFTVSNYNLYLLDDFEFKMQTISLLTGKWIGLTSHKGFESFLPHKLFHYNSYLFLIQYSNFYTPNLGRKMSVFKFNDTMTPIENITLKYKKSKGMLEGYFSHKGIELVWNEKKQELIVMLEHGLDFDKPEITPKNHSIVPLFGVFSNKKGKLIQSRSFGKIPESALKMKKLNYKVLIDKLNEKIIVAYQNGTVQVFDYQGNEISNIENNLNQDSLQFVAINYSVLPSEKILLIQYQKIINENNSLTASSNDNKFYTQIYNYSNSLKLIYNGETLKDFPWEKLTWVNKNEYIQLQKYDGEKSLNTIRYTINLKKNHHVD